MFSKAFKKSSKCFKKVFKIVSNVFKMFFKSYQNISKSFQKYFWKVFKMISNIFKSFQNVFKKCFKCFQMFSKCFQKLSISFLNTNDVFHSRIQHSVVMKKIWTKIHHCIYNTMLYSGKNTSLYLQHYTVFWNKIQLCISSQNSA